MLVQAEQQGKVRAVHVKKTLKNLSRELTKEFGKGFSVDSLENMRRFYLTYSGQIPQATSMPEIDSKRHKDF